MKPLEAAAKAIIRSAGISEDMPGHAVCVKSATREARTTVLAYLRAALEDEQLRGEVAIQAYAAVHPGEAAIQALIDDLEEGR